MNLIGNLIHDMRRQTKLRQIDVARAVGVDVSTISRLENGEHLSTPDKVDAIIVFLLAAIPKRKRVRLIGALEVYISELETRSETNTKQ